MRLFEEIWGGGHDCEIFDRPEVPTPDSTIARNARPTCRSTARSVGLSTQGPVDIARNVICWVGVLTRGGSTY